MRRQPARLVFIDETSVKTNMTPLRGRSPCGERLRAQAPFGKWRTQTFVAGLRCHELVAPWIIEGAMDGAAFDVYVRTQLAPCLDPGDVVILDNLNVHKSPRAAQAIAERGAWLLFLPKYSPDLNPIEMAFSKLKTLLRKAAARTLDELWRAVGDICALFSPTECWKLLQSCGLRCRLIARFSKPSDIVICSIRNRCAGRRCRDGNASNGQRPCRGRARS